MILYSSKGKSTQRKANIRRFKGFDFSGEDRKKVLGKFLEKKWTAPCLKDCAQLLDIADRSGSKVCRP